MGAMDIDDPELVFRRKDKGKAPLVEEDKKQYGGPWVEKYRPKTLADVAAHKDIVETIGRLSSENRLPHLLLYGPPGTGKTSTILAVARSMYGSQFQNMILELNASDDRGIDVVRNQVQDFASTQSMSFGAKAHFKLVVLDEADAMTKDAQFSLRRIIERYTKNTRFCLICNHVSKIIPALQSRCTRFRFAPLDSAHVLDRLRHVVEQERMEISPGGLDAVVRLSNGDMRKALNILQATGMSSSSSNRHVVTEESVYLCTGNPMPKDIEQIAFWLLNETFSQAQAFIQEMKTARGLALVDIVRQLQPFVMRIEMPSAVRIGVIDAMADVEYRLAFGTNEKLQLGALVGAFATARAALVASAS
eukprot:TRINITY_DN17087_c0_g2_i1.p1 TRINITY_DN17087_c0_g2~~TRINITY_DN17087_c0_g2_i1.p1  ORF type:complete len:362 (+),score=66.90 TRINITY_DN17087_c0_g2_i1:201-1286(+)